MTTTPRTPTAGKNITFSFTSVLPDTLTSEYNFEIVVTSLSYLFPLYKYSQKICIGNNNLCPIPAGTRVEVIIEIMLPEDLYIPSLFIFPEIVNNYNCLGCACYSTEPESVLF
ncbi:22810_t:CDS:2, partial [Cetraspora pellucida]